MLYAFSGYKGSGKDTAAVILIKEYGFTKISFADPLREGLLVLNPEVTVSMQLGKTINDPFTANTNVSERLADLVAAFGWDMLKREVPEVRRLMQVFGTEVGRNLLGDNVWIDLLAKRYPDLTDPESRYVITDCRFPNEVEFVHACNGDICWISRPGTGSDGHASESSYPKDKADFLINNDTNVEEFQEDVRFMLFIRGVEPIESGVTGQAN